MAGVQNSRSKGSYKVGPIGIAKLILHLRYEAGPIILDFAKMKVW